MLALAGIPLDQRFLFVDPTRESPASALGEHVVAAYDDAAALQRLASECDVVTYEFENVPELAARTLTGKVPLHPNARALGTSQDRLVEKQTFAALGIPTAPFAAIDRSADLAPALARLGAPAVLKTRRFGYDGKGQRVIANAADAERAFVELGEVPCILEGFLRFKREVSLIAARSVDRSLAFYPLVENHHESGILRLTFAPAPALSDDLQRIAETQVRQLLEHLDYVGVVTVEFFQTERGLVANEFAPRVHNSGHWSIEGAHTSQFENHLRAIAGLPLGGTTVRGHVAMLNLVGGLPEPRDVLGVADAHLHLYGKEPRPGRKVGHLTVLSATAEEQAEKLRRLIPVLVQCGAFPATLLPT
jgi:5-(carboxyamino)imidazole ribonucleotide synthase